MELAATNFREFQFFSAARGQKELSYLSPQTRILTDMMPAEDTSDESVEGESMMVKAICLW